MAMGGGEEEVGRFSSFGEPDHIHWTMVMWHLVWKHSMRRNDRTTFENFWTTKNIRFGTKHDVFGPKFGFLLTLTTYIDVWGHMIAQNVALDDTKKLCYRKFFLANRKKWPLGSENGLFWPKTSSFGQKWRFLVVQKFSKKFFFVFFTFYTFPHRV